MAKVLILGSQGNLGSILVRDFSTDYEVISWDKEDVDITDEDLVNHKIKEIKPDFIINTASYNAVDKCEEDKKEFELAQKINGEAVGFLAQAALESGAVLVHYSTDHVFAGDKEKGYCENDRPGPINHYGKTKLMGEQEIIKRSGRGLKWYLIRTSKLFGPKGNNPDAKPSFFDLVLRLTREKEELKMIKGEEISCFTYTRDLSQATKNILETRMPYDIYHLTNTGPASWHEGARYLLELKNIKNIKLKPISSKEYIRPAQRPKYSVLLNTKLESLRSWQEALREYYSRK